MSKPIIALIDSDESRGGLSCSVIRQQLEQTKLAHGFAGEEGGGEILFRALFASAPIEWNRLGYFQDVTLRLIALRLLPKNHPPAFVQGELVSQPMTTLPPPRHGRHFHCFCCPSNAGAAALLREVSALLGQTIALSEEEAQLERCECMLVYLNEDTWTSGYESFRLATAVQRAMGLGVRLLLVHEMVGAEGQDGRRGCEFSSFFSSTPQELQRGGIYDLIAVPLKGGAWREVSTRLVVRALAEDVGMQEPLSEAQHQSEAGKEGRAVGVTPLTAFAKAWAPVLFHASQPGARRGPPGMQAAEHGEEAGLSQTKTGRRLAKAWWRPESSPMLRSHHLDKMEGQGGGTFGASCRGVAEPGKSVAETGGSMVETQMTIHSATGPVSHRRTGETTLAQDRQSKSFCSTQI